MLRFHWELMSRPLTFALSGFATVGSCLRWRGVFGLPRLSCLVGCWPVNEIDHVDTFNDTYRPAKTALSSGLQSFKLDGL